jgi:RND family efflux transporter MFP subunit
MLPILMMLVALFTGPEEPLEGLIEPLVVVDVGAAVDGLLDEVLVDRGDLVEAGQPVARLESSVEELTVELARIRAESGSAIRGIEARLVFNENVLKRSEAMWKDELISYEQLEESRANVDVTKADLALAKDNQVMARLEHARAQAALDLRTIRSPVRGAVVERYLSPGELVNRTNQLEIVRVAQLDPLRVEVIAPLEMLGTVAVGARAVVLPDEPIGGQHDAVVTVVDRVVDAASGTFRIRLELPNSDYAIAAGVKCRVRFAP